MDSARHSFDNFSLHQAAARGDDARVCAAIESGADVNALDNTGRTVLACAVAGEDWDKIDASDATFMSAGRLRLLSALVRHPDISLYTLNAPQSAMRGVTPLGMAAWLNMPEAVDVLLEESTEALSVDGMDTHGATALMYAARDGSLAVVQNLLQHGARPDFRDVNHRTSIHYSLAHPQILWLCEGVLRRHRWRESESATKIRLFSDSERLLQLASASLPPADSFDPPASIVFNSEAVSDSTHTLIQAIQSSELSFLHSLLFSSTQSSISPLHPIPSPVLVNRPDPKGWSAIHHCASVARPSVDILDALYCAGCDISLFTTHEHYTALHCLARSTRHRQNDDDASALYQFTMHLVRDLRAPLSARDKHDETCIHFAAEHGDSIDVLIAFLDCDETCSVRELRNSRGLTPLQVARPEFCAAFGEDAENLRPPSSLSMRTIRPVASFGSMSSVMKWTPPAREGNDDDSLVSSSDYCISTSSQQLLANLRLTTPTLDHDPLPANLDYLDSVLRDAVQIGRDIIHHFRMRVDDIVSELDDAKAMCDSVSTLRRVVDGRVDASLEERGLAELTSRRRAKRDSEDSQVTACSSSSDHLKSLSTPSLPMGRDARNPLHRDVGISTEPLRDVQTPGFNFISGTRVVLGAEVLENLVRVESQTDRAHMVDLLDMDDGTYPVPRRAKRGSLRKEANLKLWMMKAVKEELVPDEKTKTSKSGTAKFRAWLRKKISPEPPFKLRIVHDIDEAACNVGRDVKGDPHLASAEHDEDPDAPLHRFLQRSQVILAAADRDLDSICQRTIMAEQFIHAASQSVLRAEQTIQKALKKREAALANLRSGESSFGDRPWSRGSDAPPPSPSSVSSARSSIITLPAVLRKGDDEDTKALQRLLLRKIEARMVGAFDEIDKIVGWLQIVKEVVRGVKRRTYL